MFHLYYRTPDICRDLLLMGEFAGVLLIAVKLNFLGLYSVCCSEKRRF